MNYIKFLKDISENDVNKVGGKGLSLGKMYNNGISVPDGFVITTDTYNKPLEKGFEKQILKSFENIKSKKVAVRSSAVAEDSTTSSWAGQLESYLDVGRMDLIAKIKKCWNSVNSERAKAYSSEIYLSKKQLTVAVVIQKMVYSQVSGVTFTANPITNDLSEIMIESVLGLGKFVVGGQVTPDNFIIDKRTLKIKNKTIQDKPTLSDKQIKELSSLCLKIEKLFKNPQDIEWTIDNKNKIWILQSRPITTLQP